VTRLYGTFLADLMQRPLVALRYPTAAAGFLVPHTLLICGNDGTRGDVVAQKLGINLDRFRFWQNGVDLPATASDTSRCDLVSRFSDVNLDPSKKWILSCSRLSYWKRIDRILRAVRRAVDRGAQCQLLIVGSGPEEHRLKTLAEQSDLAKHVAWLGPVDHDTIWDLMGVADSFIITNDVTNRCNPVYEAICARLPVISVHDAATADLLVDGENALLSEKDDDDALAQNITRVCTDRELADSMSGAQDQVRASLWSWRERMKVESDELERMVASWPQFHPARGSERGVI
jgi:glycosyltransferase involved in cell wall biosynthesis